MDSYYRVAAFLDRAALIHNIRLIQNRLAGRARMMAVVKSNAYGHGIREVVPVLIENGVDAFAVASMSEAIELRQFLLTLGEKPDDSMILILGYTDASEYESGIRNRIDMTVYSLAQAEALEKTAASLGETALIQLKLETGMNRIGFALTEESLHAIKTISLMKHLTIHGAFTHYARADETNRESAYEQKERYDAFLEKLEAEGIHPAYRHTANSAAIMEMPDTYSAPLPHGEKWIARAGIMLYGLYPSDEMDRSLNELKPVMTLKSHLVHIKTVPAGTPIGYGGSFVTTKETRIATVPIGYGDGYPRHLSGLGCMIVRGKRAPILGRVCMDQTMIDITDIPEAQLMDEAELFGRELPIDELADLSGTIHYEIVCQLTDRVKRIMT